MHNTEPGQKEPLSVIIVDEDPNDRLMIERTLSEAFDLRHVLHCQDKGAFEKALRFLSDNLLRPEAGDLVVITDSRLSWTDGLDVLRSVKNLSPEVPVLMFTATGSEEVAVQGLKEGLDDYIVKSLDHLQTLPAAIKVATARLKAERRAREAETRFRRLFESVPVGLAWMDAEGHISEINPAGMMILGCTSPQECEEVTRFISPPDLRKVLLALEKEGVVQNFRVAARRKDGLLIDLALHCRLSRRGDKPIIECAFADITAVTKAENIMNKVLEGTIHALSAAIEARDPYTAGHQRRVAQLSRLICERLGLDEDETHGIFIGGILHDIGKISVPAEILAKPGRLTRVEFEMIKAHTSWGREILKDVPFPWPIADMVLHHHERLDGSGYPDGLAGSQIGLGARILAVSDVVEAMVSHRPYRPALGLDVAVQELRDRKGILYDPDVSDICIEVLEEGLPWAKETPPEDESV